MTTRADRVFWSGSPMWGGGGRLDGESPFSCELGLQLVGREGGRASELTQRQWVVVHVVVVLHASGRARLGRLGRSTAVLRSEWIANTS